jgi:hypothetical protein
VHVGVGGQIAADHVGEAVTADATGAGRVYRDCAAWVGASVSLTRARYDGGDDDDDDEFPTVNG